ncbi:MAG: transcription elongation factor GreA [Anaerolineales bacterium]
MNQQEDLYLTKEAAVKIRQELEELQGPRRDSLAKRLREAIKMGDLSENADYIAAKEEQAFLEGRIQELQTILREATIVERPANPDVVGVGSNVVILENGRGQTTYQMVGAKEANPREGKISNVSPIGKALMGKRVGDTAIAETPGGQIEMKVVSIQ